MADEHRSRAEANARRVAQWLAEHEAEFEEGLAEDGLTDALSLSRDDLMEAVDHLEMREEVVRFPHPIATPRRTILKPGRGWPDARAAL